MAPDLQKGQRESKSSFGILAASLFISMVASLVLIVGSAKIETIALTFNHKDRIFSEKYLKYLKKMREALFGRVGTAAIEENASPDCFSSRLGQSGCREGSK
jgi:hypothetical protein